MGASGPGSPRETGRVSTAGASQSGRPCAKARPTSTTCPPRPGSRAGAAGLPWRALGGNLGARRCSQRRFLARPFVPVEQRPVRRALNPETRVRSSPGTPGEPERLGYPNLNPATTTRSPSSSARPRRHLGMPPACRAGSRRVRFPSRPPDAWAPSTSGECGGPLTRVELGSIPRELARRAVPAGLVPR